MIGIMFRMWERALPAFLLTHETLKEHREAMWGQGDQPLGRFGRQPNVFHHMLLSVYFASPMSITSPTPLSQLNVREREEISVGSKVSSA